MSVKREHSAATTNSAFVRRNFHVTTQQERKRIILKRAHDMDDERPNCTIPEQHEVRPSHVHVMSMLGRARLHFDPSSHSRATSCRC